MGIRSLLMVLVPLAVASCSHDATSSQTISGDWTVSLSIHGSGLTCSAGYKMHITESSPTFTGTYDSGSISCTPGGGASGIYGPITNGTINGNAIEYNVDNSDLHQVGTVSGSSMSGTANWNFVSGGSSVLLVGTWTATR